MARKITKDGFIWLLVTVQVIEIYESNLFTLYKLYDDDSEAMVESMDDLIEALDRDTEIGIEVGFIESVDDVE